MCFFKRPVHIFFIFNSLIPFFLRHPVYFCKLWVSNNGFSFQLRCIWSSSSLISFRVGNNRLNLFGFTVGNCISQLISKPIQYTLDTTYRVSQKNETYQILFSLYLQSRSKFKIQKSCVYSL